MFVTLYGYVFGSAMMVPGGGDYREFLLPGMFAQSMMFGAAATISVVAADRARGVTDQSPTQMPAWLGAVAEWNPLSATVAATRQLFGNTVPELVGESWAAQNAMFLAVAWPVLIAAVFLPLAVRRYNSVTR